MDTHDHDDATQAGNWLLGNRYRVQERIGSGGMADVFRAHDELLGRDVAVKVFRSLGPDDEAGKVAQELLDGARLAPAHYRRAQKPWLEQARRLTER